MQIVEKTKKKSTKDGSGTNQQNLDTSKDKEEEMEMAEKAKQSSTEDGDDTKETNLDTSKDKKQEHIKERSTKDGNETKNSNVDTSKDTEEEREIGANGEQSLNEGGNERKQQDVGTSKDTEEEREIGANGEQSLNEGGNERKQQDVGASKDRGEEREFGTNGEQSGAEGGNETKQQDVGTSKDKEEERETGANSEHSSTEGGNKRKQQGVGTSKTKRTRRSTKDDEMPLLENQQRQDGTSENESRAPSNDPIIQIEPDPSENELKELKEDFLQLLKDNKDITTSTKLEIAQTIVEDDPRYKRACTTDKVPQWYTEYIYEKVKEDFHTLLDEKANTIKTWRRAKMIIDHDPRYEVIGNEDVGKQFFLEYWSKNCLQCCCKKKCSCCTCCCDCLTCCCNRCTRCCNKWRSWNVFWCLLLGISYSGSALGFLIRWTAAKD
ncbi:cilia- and flagella-associated protein 251-like [Mercenaria mercenaria]|uniref:cilia- and flagella-associated protein 251-like n=1 Tax=Mercenaria mercenaria TaxID=6596 RepID=UPI00234FB210|nr:cilia- and flagella-associated protein 251-like [Mercenaria mercenaria]